MDQKYIAFISYRHMPLDSAAAKALHTYIEQYVIPRGLRKQEKKLGRVFRDLEELPASSNLSDDIYRALDNARYLIVVCSKDTAASPWVEREVEYFLSKHPQENVFTVLVSGEPGEVFPKQLTYTVDANGNKVDVEPLAVDIRAENETNMKKKLRKEITRLFAAMLGCPYDALVMRQQRRKRRQMAAIGAVVLAIALAFSGVMLVKNHQIDKKNKELAQANETLEAQKEQILLRESELLTQSAQSALAEGYTSEAMEYALSALKNDEEDRPYYAPAEQVLIRALGVFDSKQDYTVINTRLTQSTPVEEFVISGDGSKLAVLDRYGVVNCFDTAGGELLWSRSIMAQQLLSAGDTVIAVNTQTQALSFATGEILWTYEADRTYYPQGILTEDGKQMAFVRQDPDEKELQETYTAVILDTATGKEIASAQVAQGNTLLNAQSYPNMRFSNHMGVFSADGNLFAGAYCEDRSGTERLLHVYLVDVAAGTARELYSCPIASLTYEDEVYGMFFREDTLIVHRGTDKTLGIVERYDLKNNMLLYQTDCAEAQENFYGSNTGLTAVTENRVWVAREKSLQVLDLATGQVLAAGQMQGKILHLQAQETFVRIITDQGEYGFCWVNDMGIVSRCPGALKTLLQGDVFQKGYLQPHTAGGYVQGIEADGEGYVAVVSAEDPNTVMVKRPVQLQSWFPVENEELLAQDEKLGKVYTWTLDGGKMVVGPIAATVNGEAGNGFAVLNEALVREGSIFCKEENMSWENCYPLADGSGILYCDEFGNITAYGADGQTAVLSQRETVELTAMGDTVFTTSRQRSAANIRESDRAVITARIDEKELLLWVNGIAQEPVAAPEGVSFQLFLGIGVTRFLQVGGNGSVVISGYTDAEDELVDCFLIYNVTQKSWCRIDSDVAQLAGASVALSNAEDVLLLLDKTDTVFLFDTQNGTLLTQFPMQLPQKSVKQLRFLKNGAYLALRTEDMQVWIYEVATGNVVCRQQLSANSTDAVRFWEDSQRDRLYISWGSGGVCLETTQWVLLAEIPDMLCFREKENKILGLVYKPDFSGKWLQITSLPARNDLLRITREILGK